MAEYQEMNAPVTGNSGVEFAGSELVNGSAEARAEIKLVKDLQAQGKSARAEYDKHWKQRMDFYKGKQWEAGTSKPVMNIIRSTIQATLPILTDGRPGFNVLPPEPNDYQFSNEVGSLVKHWWNKSENSIEHTLIECLMDSEIYDAGFAKIAWDEKADNGRGEIVVEPVGPEDLWVNPDARDFEKDCSWVIQRSYKTVGYLKKTFPEVADYIKADSAKKKDDSEGISNEVTLVSPTDQKANTDAPTFNESDSREMCEMWETYVDSAEMEEYEDKNGEQVEKGWKLKYPQGKVITILPNQSVLLQSKPFPYKHGKKPFVRFIDAIMPRKFYGEGEVESLIDMQRVINRILANIIDYFNLMANPVWVVESDSGVDSGSITNNCGLVVETDPGGMNKLKRDIPPAMQAGVLDLYNTMLRMPEIITGVGEVTQGRKPIGVQAGVAIEALQEASQTRIRLKERNLKVTLAQLGYQVVALMMQYYKAPRVARITGQNDWPGFFEFFVEDTPEGYVINKRDYAYDEANKKYVAPEAYQTMGPSKGIFDIEVLSGTALPFAKAQRMNLALDLRKQGDLSREGLYEAIEWPNKEEELKRMAEQEQAQAQAQAQQQAMNGGK